VLGIRSGKVYDFFKQIAYGTLQHNNQTRQIHIKETAWATASNGDSQAGALAVLLASYLQDPELLDWCWTGYRRYCGEKNAHQLADNQFGDGWQWTLVDGKVVACNTPEGRVGIVAKGVVVNGLDIGGSITNDSGRANDKPVIPLKWDERNSLYPWVGANGMILAAAELERQLKAVGLLKAGQQGPFELQDRAPLRFLEYQRRIDQMFPEDHWWPSKKEEVKYIGAMYYNLDKAKYPWEEPVGPHDVIGYEDVFPFDLWLGI
jgi:hypothetical protein